MRAGAGTSRSVAGLASRPRYYVWLVLFPLSLSAWASPHSQPTPDQLNETGRIVVSGRSTPYIIHHLPVASFPQIPMVIQSVLSDRNCLIPQTYEAHRPENVIQGSFERAGSSDWAVLCSRHGTVSLLVFFGSDPEHPFTLATAPETEKLQVHDPTGVLGFNWGIDPASPEQVREAQAGMYPRPPKVSHFAVADSIVEHSTEYHYYSNGAWTLLPTPD
jgi:hypothetical protein